MLEAQHTHAGGTAEEHPSRGRRQPVPAGRDHPDDVAAGKRQNVARYAVNPSDEAVSPDGDVLGRFAAWATVAK